GSPFASPQHHHQAELLRANRSPVPQNQNMPSNGVPPSTLSLLVRDSERRALAGIQVKLLITHESIAHSNTETARDATTNLHGRAAFVSLNTNRDYKYETVVEQSSARYSTSDMRLQRESDQISI